MANWDLFMDILFILINVRWIGWYVGGRTKKYFCCDLSFQDNLLTPNDVFIVPVAGTVTGLWHLKLFYDLKYDPGTLSTCITINPLSLPNWLLYDQVLWVWWWWLLRIWTSLLSYVTLRSNWLFHVLHLALWSCWLFLCWLHAWCPVGTTLPKRDIFGPICSVFSHGLEVLIGLSLLQWNV